MTIRFGNHFGNYIPPKTTPPIPGPTEPSEEEKKVSLKGQISATETVLQDIVNQIKDKMNELRALYEKMGLTISTGFVQNDDGTFSSNGDVSMLPWEAALSNINRIISGNMREQIDKTSQEYLDKLNNALEDAKKTLEQINQEISKRTDEYNAQPKYLDPEQDANNIQMPGAQARKELLNLGRDMGNKLNRLAKLYKNLGISDLKQYSAINIDGSPAQTPELTAEGSFYYKIKDVFDEIQTADIGSMDLDALNELIDKAKSAIEELDTELEKREAENAEKMKEIISKFRPSVKDNYLI